MSCFHSFLSSECAFPHGRFGPQPCLCAPSRGAGVPSTPLVSTALHILMTLRPSSPPEIFLRTPIWIHNTVWGRLPAPSPETPPLMAPLSLLEAKEASLYHPVHYSTPTSCPFLSPLVSIPGALGVIRPVSSLPPAAGLLWTELFPHPKEDSRCKQTAG